MMMSCSRMLDTLRQDGSSTEDIQQREIDLDLDTSESPTRLTVDTLHPTENKPHHDQAMIAPLYRQHGLICGELRGCKLNPETEHYADPKSTKCATTATFPSCKHTWTKQRVAQLTGPRLVFAPMEAQLSSVSPTLSTANVSPSLTYLGNARFISVRPQHNWPQ
jgi:hypothetical protein